MDKLFKDIELSNHIDTNCRLCIFYKLRCIQTYGKQRQDTR